MLNAHRLNRPLVLAVAVAMAACQDFTVPIEVPMHAPSTAVVPNNVYTVINTLDVGAGSLRQAILDANGSPGLDAIHFAIGSGVQTIQPASGLPWVTDPVIIDGTTQPGFAGTPVIELDGTNAGTFVSGIYIRGGGTTVRGLVINRFFASGIMILGGDPGGNVIEGNYIGTDVTGMAALGNGNGILVQSADNRIGGTLSEQRNVISGNGKGMQISNGGDGSSTRNQVLGNYIGVDASGTGALGNLSIGVHLGNAPNNRIGGTETGAGNVISNNGLAGVNIQGFQSAASGNRVQGNLIGTDATGTVAMGNGWGTPTRGTNILVQSDASGNLIGGTEPGAGNVISGAKDDGVMLVAGGTTVQGNHIGTDITGMVGLPNRTGVTIASDNNVVGGSDPMARNVISGNVGTGVQIDGNASGSVVQGNYIGTDISGGAALPNGSGIGIRGSHNTIGGRAAGEGNVISGNSGAALSIQGFPATHAQGNAILGNFIGTDATGSAALGNGGTGIRLINNTDGTLIGDTVAGAGNVIAYNGLAFDEPGIGLHNLGSPAVGQAILSNRIFANGGLGIDLSAISFDHDGVTPNDAGDTDVGPNDLQNFPTLTSVGSCGASTVIEGTLASSPSASFLVELFASPSADPSGYGEGMTVLGRVPVATDATGTGSFQLALATGPADGFAVTATATNAGGSTSEFSAAVPVVNLGPAQIIAALRAAILELAATGAFESEEQSMGLLKKLDQAGTSLLNDRPNAAMLLDAFIAEIQGLMTAGILTAEQGGALISSAQCAVAALG